MLAIVGSTDLTGNYIAEMAIEAAIDAHTPRLVVSGGAKGIDTMAQLRATQQGIEVKVFKPVPVPFSARTGKAFIDGGFKDRNLAIAIECECLVRLHSTTSRTYGSGWTADHAHRIGKRVWATEIENGPRPADPNINSYGGKP